jgi:hypothetical protein
MGYIKIWKIVLMSALLMTSSCKHKAEVPADPAISFSTQVQPIVVNNCAQSGCHDGSGHLRPLKIYSDIKDNVTPGNANNSRLYTKIVDRSMPPANPLTDEQAKLIYIWIMQGAQSN